MRRLGLAFTGQPYSIGEVIAAAQAAEAAGFEAVWIAEDFWTGRDAISVLSCLALSTQRIKLGTCLISIHTRHPALIAMTLNTLSDLARDRLTLGVGIGGRTWQTMMASDLAQRSPVQAMRETIAAIRTLLAGGEVTWGTETVSLARSHGCFNLGHRALVPGSVPVYIGAVGPRMTELTGEIADGLLLIIGARRDEMPTRLRQLAAGAGRAKRDPKSVDIAKLIVASVSDDGVIDDATLCWVAQFVTRLDEAEAQRLGFDPERTCRIREEFLRGSYRSAAGLLSRDMVSTFVAAGRPAECLDAMEQFVAAGVTLPVLVSKGGDLHRLIQAGAEYVKLPG